MRIAILVGFLGGCAVSPARYAAMEREVEARNAERYRIGAAAFAAKGYAWETAPDLWATMSDADWRACRAVARAEAPAPRDAVMIAVAPYVPPERPQPAPIELRVAPAIACEFFGGGAKLRGPRSGGGETWLIRLADDHVLARDRQGRPVVVVVARRVISRREVTVEQDCDHMPDPGPGRFGRPERVRVALTPSIPRRVAMVVGHEALTGRCTTNTY
jgi:hypothetical protein